MRCRSPRSARNERSRRGGNGGWKRLDRRGEQGRRRTGTSWQGWPMVGLPRGCPSRGNRGRFQVHRAPREARIPEERSILVVARQTN